MRVATGWDNYELLDVSDGQRLESWSGYIVVRPDPQVIVKTKKEHPLWDDADAYYHRSRSGGGSWEFKRSVPSNWTVSWREKIKLQVLLTAFKHTGVFPEQAVNWELYMNILGKEDRPVEVLNLFSYTGGASVACLKAGASLTHVDASKGMIALAKTNCSLSGVREKNIRFIADDCKQFVEREIRRNRKYDAIIMDPPSYGRGPTGEKWKFEDDIFSLVSLCKELLTEDPLFFVINSYTSSISPATMKFILSLVLQDYEGVIVCDEIGLAIKDTNLAIPSGSTAYYTKNR